MDVAERMTDLNEVEHSKPPRHALHDALWDGAARDALALVQETLDHSSADTAHPAALVAALNVLRQLRAQLAGWEPELIAAARAQKASWAALAPALGVTSRQAAERRYLRLRPSDNGERTGEERVRGHRDRRVVPDTNLFAGQPTHRSVVVVTEESRRRAEVGRAQPGGGKDRGVGAREGRGDGLQLGVLVVRLDGLGVGVPGAGSGTDTSAGLPAAVMHSR